MDRNDPLVVGRYRVELGDVGEAVFLECAGLKNTTEVVELWEGGENRDVHKFPGNTKFTNIVLKNGFGRFTSKLRELRDAVVDGSPPMTFDGAIVLLDDEGEEAARWTFSRGFFARWEGPDIKGGGNALAIDTLEIACDIWTFESRDDKYKPPVPPTPKPPDNILALFTPMRRTIFEGEEVSFTDRSISTKPIASWEWRCSANDGWTSTDQNPTAKFDKAGAYRVVLRVTSESGKSDTASGTVTVRRDRIRADFDAEPETIIQGGEIQFRDRSESVHEITEWAWSCPDNDGWTSSDKDPVATFGKPGTFLVELSVTSSTGKSDSVKKPVTVEKEEVKAEFEFNPDTVKDGKLDKFKFIQFKVASHELTWEAKKLLDEAVKVFQDNEGLRVDLQGWASKEGGAAYNLALSRNRARSVQKYMKSKGIGSSQIVKVEGFGETEQFAAGNSEEQLKQNRRVEWVIRPDSVTTLKIRVGDKVLFTDKSTSNTSIQAWKWSCPAADWVTSDTDQHPVATFSSAGTHQVTLEVTGAAGETDSVTHEIVVHPAI